MGKVLLGVIAALASLMLVDSLTCNTCPFGVAGFCLIPTTKTCATNTSVCSTASATFPALSSFKGFSISSCVENGTSCNTNSSSTLLGFTYETKVTCCGTDKCNTVSAAPSTRTTLGAVVGMAAVAWLWGSVL